MRCRLCAWADRMKDSCYSLQDLPAGCSASGAPWSVQEPLPSRRCSIVPTLPSPSGSSGRPASSATESASSSSTSPKQYSSRSCSAPASPARGSRLCCRECNGISRVPRVRLPFARQYYGIWYCNMPAIDGHWIAYGNNGFMIIQCAASLLNMCTAHLARTKNHNSL